MSWIFASLANHQLWVYVKGCTLYPFFSTTKTFVKCYYIHILIARFVGQTWGPSGADRAPRWAPCWPHEPCYLGMFPVESVHYVDYKYICHYPLQLGGGGWGVILKWLDLILELFSWKMVTRLAYIIDTIAGDDQATQRSRTSTTIGLTVIPKYYGFSSTMNNWIDGILWLIVTWFLALPSHQQSWYFLCRINMSSFTGRDVASQC